VEAFRYKRGVIIHGDCLDVMKKVRKGSVDLVVADPPFNINYDYGGHYEDKLSKEDYLAWTVKWLTNANDVLNPYGSIVVAIGDDYAADLKIILDSLFHYRNWIIWHYRFGVHCNTKFGRGHTHLLYYTKSKTDFTFNADDVRVPSLRQTKYNDRRANPKGRVPSDVWTFKRIAGTHKERTGHPCQMPEAILERIVKALTDENGVVLDPFAGSGTTAKVAMSLGRRFITCDTVFDYVVGVRRRLRDCEKSRR
jgi:DNA modification methylase